MTPAEAVELTGLLKKKFADKPCPRCGNTQFSVLGQRSVDLEGVANGLIASLYKVSVPTVVVGCNNCGFLTSHAIAALREQDRRSLAG